MEQVGTSSLPPLLPSVPVAVPVADPEQSTEQGICSLTELVPVRSKQPTSALDRSLAAEEELVDDPAVEEDIEDLGAEMEEDPLAESSIEVSDLKNSALIIKKFEAADGLGVNNVLNIVEVPAEAVSEAALVTAPETRTGTRSSTPTFQVPPHLLGRTVEDPSADIPPGRRTQKPRLGVRVPYRNLTSQIVTQREIAQEIFERSAKKHPNIMENMIAQGANIAPTEMFTRKLTQRLASSITPQTAKPKTAVVPESMGTLKALLPSKQSAAAADGVRLSPGFTHSEKEKGLDEAELLSILEGDGDPLWLPDKLLRQAEGASAPTAAQPASGSTHLSVAQVPNSTSPQPPALKLDPVLEKELALKQLMELPLAFPPRKPEKKEKPDKLERATRKRGSKIKQEVVQNDQNAVSTPAVEAPAVPGEIPATDVLANGENVGTAPLVVTPAKKVTSSRKRKMTPEVEAVLKKPKLTKKAEPKAETKADTKPETVANGKAKGTKTVSNQGTQGESGKKKSAGNRKSQAKTEVEPLVTNGSAEVKKKVSKRGEKKPEETPRKKPVPKTPPTKTAARSSKSPNKSQTPTPPKQSKTVERTNEDIDDEEQPMVIAEELSAPVLEPAQELPESQPQQKKPTKINRELEHLLGDEGAVNMLYAVEGHKRKVPSKDLALKARLVKTAVMRLSTNPQGHMPLALRARRSLNVTEPPKLVKMSGNRKQRHLSSESLDSMRSPPYLTPVDGASSHVFPPRQKPTADDSRIIRRHSSSSSFSSPDVSPRRVSIEDANAAAASQVTSGSARKKGVPIFVRDKAKTLTYDGKKKPKIVNPVALDSAFMKEKLLFQSKKPNLLPNPAALKTKDLRKISSSSDAKTRMKANLLKRVAKLHKTQLLAEKKAAEEMAKAKKAAEELLQVQQEDNNVLPLLATAIKQEGKKNSAPLSPDAASEACKCSFGACLASCEACVMGPLSCVSPTGYSNLLKSLHQKGKRVQGEERQRATARHCAGTYNYKEITVRRYDNIVHVILAPVSTKMICGLNVQVLRELRDALQQVRKDDLCKVVLLTSSGSIFCQGIDLSALIHNNNEKRKTAAFEMSLALKDFIKCIAHFPKTLVAGVQGSAMGLGVTMLPLFDMVFASDKATFHTPYAQLGQVPEGGATLTLPYMLGHTATSELLLNCRKMTANEALQCGLVTRVLWPDRFLEELIPVVKNIAQQSAQSMEATKALLRHGLRTKFDAALESETHLLVTHWTSKECQTSLQRSVDNGEVCVQRQRSVDA